MYVALSHNHFSHAHGSDFSPLEYTQLKLSKPSFAMFGQSVLAELLDSLRAQSPNETRSIEACFCAFKFRHRSCGTGCIADRWRVGFETFCCTYNVRPITPIAWKHIIGDQLFVEVQ